MKEEMLLQSREHFISLCNKFWNWQELDEITAGEEEPRLEWDGQEFTHRVTQALWRMYQAALQPGNSAQPVTVPEKLPLDYLQGQKDGLEWAAQMAEANHPQTGDWLYDDPIELAKAIRKGPDMPKNDNTLVIPDGLIAAVNRLLDSDGSRGCFSAIKCYDAHEEVERLLAAVKGE